MPNPLSFTSGPTYGTGKFGQAASAFKGQIPSAVLGTTAGVAATIEGWFNYTAGSNSYNFFLGRQANSSTDWVVGFNGSTITLYANGTFNNGPTTYADGQWRHWALVVASDLSAKLWVEGAVACAASGGVDLMGYYPDLLDLGQGNNKQFAGALDEVAIWAGQKYTAPFTPPTAPYTGAETGLKALYHLDGNGADSQGAAASGITVAANDASLASAFSPYTWYWDGASANANSPGSYAKFKFSGTSLGVNLVASVGAATLAWSIDNGPLQTASLQAASLTLATGLAADTHTAELHLLSSDNNANRWSLATALRIKSFTLDTGGAVTAPTLRSKKGLFFSDSLGEGFKADVSQASNALLAEVPALMRALDAEYGQICYAGQGFVQAGAGDVPSLANAYNLYSASVSRLTGGVLSPAPDYLFCMEGANNGGTQAQVAAQISAFRTMAPSAAIFMVIEPGGFIRPTITAAVQAAVSAGDNNLFLVDAGAVGDKGLGQYGTPSKEAADGLHPGYLTNIGLAALHAVVTKQQLNPHRFTVVPA